MAPSRAKSTSLSANPLLPILLFGALLLFLIPAVLASSPQPPDSKTSPSADVDLICHTDNPNECYPKTFQPTEEFQIIHPDQDIPPGLHVRLNIYTGVKEARLNIDGDDNPALEGLPVDKGVVVVEPEKPLVVVDENYEGDSGSGKDGKVTMKVPSGAPVYDPVGKLKPPTGGAEPQFTEALDLFRKLGFNPDDKSDRTSTVDGALEELRELAHDAYYGMLIAADKEVVKGLFCQMLSGGQEGQNARDQAAAYVLAGALSNNPSAVKELVPQWEELMQSTCKPDDPTKLIDLLYSNFAASTEPSSANTAKARIAALNGMLESPAIRTEFLSQGGMQSLLDVLSKTVLSQGQAQGVREWEAAARRAGQLVLDRFLDEEMGATLGVWPGAVRMLGEQDCRAGSGGKEGGQECWRYVAGKAMKGGSGEWSRDLWQRLEAYEGRGEGKTEL